MENRILVTGGAGYIGSHTCLLLLKKGYKVTVFDNLCNSSEESLTRVQHLAEKPLQFYNGDIRDKQALASVFKTNHFDTVIHFAGLKSVSESVDQPLVYYENNIAGTINLLHAMQEAKVTTLVFSSSATVYGEPQSLPLREDAPRSVTNPYGRSKLVVEDMLYDLHTGDPSWKIARLRYFNPVGAHPSGLIGEDPLGIPNNLMPFISQVAARRQNELLIFGADYKTHDGTGIRDFIHVLDLSEGHLAALEYMRQNNGGMLLTFNLGTGRGTSVLEMVKAFEKVCNVTIPHRFVSRRPGDIASCFADPSLAKHILGWQTKYNIEDMCRDTWRWQSLNPNGY